MKRFITLLMLITLSLVLALPAMAERSVKRTKSDQQTENRYGLVIGNGTYKDSPLKNPVNDATDIAAALRRSGFKVTLLTNGNRKQMKKAISTFGKKLRNSGVGLFYFAGHGLQVDGRNYLVPVGAELESESDAEFEAVDAGRVLGKMEDAGNDVNIVILDACRNNPYSRSFRSASKGLAQMDAPTGSIVAYATSPGSVAADGHGRNGVYTKHLLKYLRQQNLSIGQLFMQVRKGVLRDTGNKQTPWESSSLTGNFYFRGEGSLVVSPTPVVIGANNAGEQAMWQLVAGSNNTSDVQLFLDTYPSGRYGGAAQLKLAQLERAQRMSQLTISTTPRILAKGEVSLEKFFVAVIDPKEATILDVRTVDETDGGKLLGSIAIPLDEVCSRLGEIPNDRPVYIYCTTGARAEIAAKEMKKYNYDSFFLVAEVECDGPECEFTE